jgi:pSer/pThr/pTyr-binding forkhead associated (FHA) protein
VSHVYCSECGFQNPEVANYCARCGALLRDEVGDETTLSYTPEEDGVGETSLEHVEGPALVIRSGGGRAGEAFQLDRERTTIGRSPECDVFLDDVTVSRRHAVVTRTESTFTIEDQGSLNGTFVNRRRIETGDLEDDDELQIGKYRLVFLAR